MTSARTIRLFVIVDAVLVVLLLILAIVYVSGGGGGDDGSDDATTGGERVEHPVVERVVHVHRAGRVRAAQREHRVHDVRRRRDLHHRQLHVRAAGRGGVHRGDRARARR